MTKLISLSIVFEGCYIFEIGTYYQMWNDTKEFKLFTAFGGTIITSLAMILYVHKCTYCIIFNNNI